MLDKVSQIKLAKVLALKFNSGDWRELFAVTDCEDVPAGLNQFYRHVEWGNDQLKGVAIAAIETTLPGMLITFLKSGRWIMFNAISAIPIMIYSMK